MLVVVPLEGDALTENKTPRIVDKLIAQTVNEGDIATFECRFVSPVQPQVSCFVTLVSVVFQFSRITRQWQLDRVQTHAGQSIA